MNRGNATRGSRIAVGVPVYNGQEYLDEALESLTAQDYEDFEILVSDNCSTDATPDIAQRWASLDARVRYSRTSTNIGAIGNFRRAFDLTQSDLFMWAAHDDRWAPTYLSECQAALQAESSAVLACSQVVRIGPAGDVLQFDHDVDHNFSSVGMSVPRRVGRLLERTGWYAIYGLIRRDALARTTCVLDPGRAARLWGPDVVFLLELSLMGTFAKVEKPLFFYRYVEKPVEKVMVTLDPAAATTPASPNRDLLFELLRAAWLRGGHLWHRGRLLVIVGSAFCVRNSFMRRTLGGEAVDEITASRRRGRRVRISTIVLAALAAPEAIARWRSQVLTRLLQTRGLPLLWLVPVYVLLTPKALVASESWRAVARAVSRRFSRRPRS
jgi:glycosyltransferase involved in cell wall biosynthesis